MRSVGSLTVPSGRVHYTVVSHMEYSMHVRMYVCVCTCVCMRERESESCTQYSLHHRGPVNPRTTEHNLSTVLFRYVYLCIYLIKINGSVDNALWQGLLWNCNYVTQSVYVRCCTQHCVTLSLVQEVQLITIIPVQSLSWTLVLQRTMSTSTRGASKSNSFLYKLSKHISTSHIYGDKDFYVEEITYS